MHTLYEIPRVRACQNCASAKVKCEPYSSNTACKRCTTHSLQCVLKERVTRKRLRAASDESDGGQLRSSGSPSKATWSQARLAELQRGLEHYREVLFRYFPFVVPPHSCQPVAEFATTKPFLSSVIIMLGCTHDRKKQVELATQARVYLAIHVLQNGEKSLDLLQGLLLINYWYNIQTELKDQRSTLVHLALGMMVDLELNKSPFARRRRMTIAEAADGIQADDVRKEHTLEEKRAYLGCLFVSSTWTRASVNVDAFHLGQYADSCWKTLAKSDQQSDQMLVHLCLLQDILERFSIARSSFSRRYLDHNLASESIYEDLSQSHRDVVGFVKYWDQRLTKRWSAIPEIERTSLLLVQYGYARVYLHECCLEDRLFTTTESRLEVTHGCIAAIKFLTGLFVHMSEQPEALFNMPAHFGAQTNHSMFVSVQLCSVSCGNLTAELVDRELDLTRTFDVLIARLSETLASTPSNKIPSFMRRFVPMAKAIQKGFTTKKQASAGPKSGSTVDSPTDAIAGQLDFDFLDQFLEFDDSMWFQGLLAADEHKINSAS